MLATVHLYSDKKGELNRFLSSFFNTWVGIESSLKWEKEYHNPIELADIIGTYIENSEDFFFNMWICLDENVYLQINDNNADPIIRYLYERFPY